MFLKRLALPALALSALVLAGCSSPAEGPAQAPTEGSENTASPVTLGLTYIPNVQFAPTYVGVEEGYFAGEGADVTIRHHGSDEGLFTALFAGEEDMVVATGDEMAIARSQGMDLLSVGQYYAKYPVVVIVKEDSDIKTFEDLRGRKVGLPGEFGSNWYGLLSALAAHNMSVNDIELTSIGFTQLAALQSGEVEAVVGFTNNDTVQFGLANVGVRELEMSPEGGLPLIGANVVTTSKFASENPDLVKAVLEGLRQAKQLCVDDPDKAVEVTKGYDPNLSAAGATDAAKATLVATNKLFEKDGEVTMRQDLDTWAAMLDFLATQDGLLASDVKLDETVTNDFVK